MNLVSLSCLCFATITVLLYFIIPQKHRWLVLLAANVFFYITYGPVYIVFLILCAAISWIFAIILEKTFPHRHRSLKALKQKKKKINYASRG